MSGWVCPFCGPRALSEFEFWKTVAESSGAGAPAPSGDTSHEAFAQLYTRLELPDSSLEHWQHSAGCRAWLEVRRNPATGALLSLRLLEAS